MAKIVCGPNELEGVEWDGKTIEDVKNLLTPILNIPRDATILLNGNQPSGNVSLRAGDELEFVKASGDKGSR